MTKKREKESKKDRDSEKIKHKSKKRYKWDNKVKVVLAKSAHLRTWKCINSFRVSFIRLYLTLVSFIPSMRVPFCAELKWNNKQYHQKNFITWNVFPLRHKKRRHRMRRSKNLISLYRKTCHTFENIRKK